MITKTVLRRWSKTQRAAISTLEGDISLSVFPWIGLDLGAVELSNPPGFTGAAFARSEAAKIRVKLMPLLSKSVEMDTVQLNGLAVNLVRNADGSTNFDDLLKPKSDQGTKPEDAGAKPGLAGLAIGGLNITDSSFSWKDALSGKNYELANLNAQTGAVRLGEPVTLDVSFDLQGGPPTVQGGVKLTGTLNVDLDAQRYAVEGLSLDTDMQGDAVGGGKLTASLAGAMLADMVAQTASVTGLKLVLKTEGAGVPGSTIDAELAGDIATNMATQATTVSGLNVKIDASGAAGEGSEIKAALSGDVSADMAKQSAKVGTLAIDVDAKGGDIPARESRRT